MKKHTRDLRFVTTGVSKAILYEIPRSEYSTQFFSDPICFSELTYQQRLSNRCHVPRVAVKDTLCFSTNIRMVQVTNANGVYLVNIDYRKILNIVKKLIDLHIKVESEYLLLILRINLNKNPREARS